MIDSKTKKRVIVMQDLEYGPYVRVSTWADMDFLEDVLSEDYYILFDMRFPKELEEDGGQEFLFGNAADSGKLQKILDEIEVPHK